jgi:hypothetical protein
VRYFFNSPPELLSPWLPSPSSLLDSSFSMEGRALGGSVRLGEIRPSRSGHGRVRAPAMLSGAGELWLAERGRGRDPAGRAWEGTSSGRAERHGRALVAGRGRSGGVERRGWSDSGGCELRPTIPRRRAAHSQAAGSRAPTGSAGGALGQPPNDRVGTPVSTHRRRGRRGIGGEQ